MLAAALVLSGCVTAEPEDASDATPAPTPTAITGGAGSELPAVDPERPTRQAFAAEARDACAATLLQRDAAQLEGDPFLADASPADVAAAQAHYRATGAAATAMADRLWEFGLPPGDAARRLIALLDTVAQYSTRAADLLGDGDLEAAQPAVGATAEALRRVDRVARRVGVGPLETCGAPAPALAGARTVRVDATDFAFVAPALRRGPVRFVVRNRGVEDHQLFVVRLRRAGTLRDALAADRRDGRPGRFLVGEGATSPVVAPGDRTTLDVRLRRGPVALLCFVASPDGTPHAYKGMALEVDVR